ncbi:MAG TPA: hypothetical protein VI876_13620 [Dehalococcoidia bacterium]|nr:hypothetical protein [Dehalococcoidia bacterium]
MIAERWVKQTDLERKNRADRLYEQYARPLEREHAGEFVAISAEGKTVLGADLKMLVSKAKASLGPGNFIFKIGDRAVGRWR